MSGIRPKRPHPATDPVLARALGQVSPLEKEEQRWLFAWAELQAGAVPGLTLMFAIPNAGGYTGGFKKNAGRVLSSKKEGTKSGVPDVFLPVARGKYHGLFIELKRRDAVPSDTSSLQRFWIQSLLEQGYQVKVCAGWEVARATIEEYLGIRS